MPQASAVSAGPTRAYALLRRAVRDGLESGLTEALARERIDQRDAGLTRDFAEGARAFLDRRAPVFTGG
jgi:2-(1,2-epoxy-1,2-dihydrophenyl)acetyl-CoA isomerase